ncbi:WS/DGAT/MGAT family O-acyltransferase [Nocardia sp. alder85J]|uniref:WS/DGAT/MGAT family O-acyltransferase n=1 Tax=Nocardia sp. alder85J TaxID=2862949 RepID=UPI001CD2B586|nr:wax ester/triacylglycerol synthase family O-acyltransferase [Nocardia sp. alder85J]MCX4092155.1 wax ester/triacylglycerol synthase family O-acyltransferase [Nocardia sp. alder85J]
MITRLTPQDAACYRLESSRNPMHVGSLAIVGDPDDPARPPLDYGGLTDLVAARLSLVPRYRRKVREVPFALGRPVWVDDGRFELGFHLRRATLAGPGADDRLFELVARLTALPLDHTRPLWEMYLIEGLSGGRRAVLTKTHSALVDGRGAVEIGQVLFDTGPAPRTVTGDRWAAAQEPGEAQLLARSLVELAGQPGTALELLWQAGSDASPLVGAAGRAVEKMVSAVRGAVAPGSPFNTPTSPHRRFDVVRTDQADYRTIGRSAGCSLDDVILAVVTGALRIFLQARGQVLTESEVLRAVVPASMCERPRPAQSILVDLPVGEPNPVMRLSHIRHATAAHSRRRLDAAHRTLVQLPNFAPASLHALSVRSASTFAGNTFNLVITNAPGPTQPMYLAGARTLEMYPVSPLLRNQASSIGITVYDGQVFYGLNADRDAMADIGVLSAAMHESMEEMLGACAQ